jgi:Skp family chaperone for outer membrane proteins
MQSNWTWPTVACVALCGTIWMVRDDLHAQAGPARTGGVAVVDIGRLFNENQQTRDIDTELQARRTGLDAKAQELQQSAEKAKLVLDSFNPNSPEFRRQQQVLQRRALDIRHFAETVEADIKREKRNWTIETYNLIVQSVAEVAKKRNVEVVLTYHAPEMGGPDRAAILREIILREVVYRADHVDMTDEVLNVVNQHYKNTGGRSTIKLMIGPDE